MRRQKTNSGSLYVIGPKGPAPHVMTFGYRLSKGTSAQAEWRERVAAVEAANTAPTMLEAHLFRRGHEDELHTIYQDWAGSAEEAIAKAKGYLILDPNNAPGTPSPWSRVVVYFGAVDPKSDMNNLSRHGTPVADLWKEQAQ